MVYFFQMKQITLFDMTKKRSPTVVSNPPAENIEGSVTEIT